MRDAWQMRAIPQLRKTAAAPSPRLVTLWSPRMARPWRDGRGTTLVTPHESVESRCSFHFWSTHSSKRGQMTKFPCASTLKLSLNLKLVLFFPVRRSQTSTRLMTPAGAARIVENRDELGAHKVPSTDLGHRSSALRCLRLLVVLALPLASAGAAGGRAAVGAADGESAAALPLAGLGPFRLPPSTPIAPARLRCRRLRAMSSCALTRLPA